MQPPTPSLKYNSPPHGITAHAWGPQICYSSVCIPLFQRSSRHTTEIHVQYSTACLTVWLCRICLRHNIRKTRKKQKFYEDMKLLSPVTKSDRGHRENNSEQIILYYCLFNKTPVQNCTMYCKSNNQKRRLSETPFTYPLFSFYVIHLYYCFLPSAPSSSLFS